MREVLQKLIFIIFCLYKRFVSLFILLIYFTFLLKFLYPNYLDRVKLKRKSQMWRKQKWFQLKWFFSVKFCIIWMD